ncbi:hypothetical protein [Burkholderia multivorans]|uniref:Putative membrane protein n=1 Tax=Burkholderia multivorans CGD2 TaxID=513052 RepID=B9BX43_9BURK|nr:hypothetical protein [Burkholderia multivorans]EEE04553.1 putative membrane protein [Burkholderia multivorans CGD2]EEE11193.1 putative membrane protein [Burkholderia multivorans CGD2M]
MMHAGGPSWAWFFEQHVDHRIPIQKLLHLITLRMFGFDFRVLDGLNVVIAAMISAAFILSAKAYRGNSNVGDLFIPLSLLSLGSGYTQWGFEFQFLSTIAFSAAFLLCAARGATAGAMVSLMLCSWTGLNGVLLSTFIGAATVGYLVVMRQQLTRLALAVLIASLLQNIALWLTWTPSAASDRHATLPAIAAFVAGMTNGPMLVYAFQHPWWKIAILGTLIAAGFCCAVVLAIQRKSPKWFLLCASLAAAMLLTVATAYGRAKEMAWAPGLEMHYGTLAMLMPIIAWIALSTWLPRRAATAVGLLLVCLFARAYWANYQWREAVAANDAGLNDAAASAIAGTAEPASVVSAHISRYFFIDTPRVRQAVTAGISLLRSR